MSRTRIVALLLAVSVLAALAVWVVFVRAFWRTNSDFAEQLLASAASDSSLHRELLPAHELEALSPHRHLLAGTPRRVLADETWGALEFGYCLPSGAFTYLTFATNGEPPKPASLTVYVPTSLRSQICLPR
jgi:hypothetical protein